MKIGILNLPGAAGYVLLFTELAGEDDNLIESLRMPIVADGLRDATGARAVFCFDGAVEIDEKVDGKLTPEHEAYIRDMLPPTGEDLELGVVPDGR